MGTNAKSTVWARLFVALLATAAALALALGAVLHTVQPAHADDGYYWRPTSVRGDGSGVVTVYKEDDSAPMGRVELSAGDWVSASDTILIQVQVGPYSTLSSGYPSVYICNDDSTPSGLGYSLSSQDGIWYRFDNSSCFSMPASNVTVSATFVETVAHSVLLTWDDGDNWKGERPEKVKATLYADGSPIDTRELTEGLGGAWVATVDGLPAEVDGKAVSYSWGIEDVDLPAGYTLSSQVYETSTTLTLAMPYVTVTFNGSGGTPARATKYTDVGGTVAEPDRPSKDGWNFGGWFTDEARTQKFDFSTPINEDLTLYAVWYVRVFYDSYVTPAGSPSTENKVQFGSENPASTAMYYAYEGAEVSLAPVPAEATSSSAGCPTRTMQRTQAASSAPMIR